MGAPSVVSVEGDKPVIEYLLRKSAKENDWVSIEKICEENTHEIKSTDFSLWARSKFMLGKFADCYEVCYKSYANNKENVPLDICRFMLRSSLKLDDEEKIQFSHDIFHEFFPEDGELMRNLIQINYRNDNFHKCIEICDKILESDQENSSALKFRARSLTKIGQNQSDIRSAWSRLLSLENENLEAMNNIARTFISENKFDSASDTIFKILDSNPDYLPAKNSLSIYLRSLIYFEEDDSFVASEIRRIMDKFGETILLTILSLILKSGKYDLIMKAGISNNYSSLLDPIQGSLANEKFADDFKELWIDLNHKITHVLSKCEGNESKINFYNAMIEVDTLHPLFESNERIPFLESESLSSTLDVEKINDMCEKIRDHSFNLDSEIVDNGLKMIFSGRSQIPQSNKHIGRILRISYSFSENGLLVSEFIQTKNYEENSLEFLEKRDPRQILGRFHGMTIEIGSRNSLLLSSMLRVISSRYPSEILFDNDYALVKVASTILGYPSHQVTCISREN